MTSMNFSLGEEIEALREMAHRFAQQEIKPLAEEMDRTNEFPRAALWEKIGELGLLGVTVADEYGGVDMGYLTFGIVLEELGRQLTASPLYASGFVGASALQNQAEFGLLGAATLAIAWLVDVTVTPALCIKLIDAPGD